MNKQCLICERIVLIKENKNKFFVKELSTGYVVLADFQLYEGYTLFLGKTHTAELHQLEPEMMKNYLLEMAVVAKAVYQAFNPVKLNYELLGNGHHHLHWHLIPRHENDPDLSAPIWKVDKSIRYAPKYVPSDQQLAALKEKLLKSLSSIRAF